MTDAKEMTAEELALYVAGCVGLSGQYDGPKALARAKAFERAAYLRGAEDMREMAAQLAASHMLVTYSDDGRFDFACEKTSEAIHALPLAPAAPHTEGE